MATEVIIRIRLRIEKSEKIFKRKNIAYDITAEEKIIFKRSE